MNLLAWISPPLIGGLIGYSTNAVAIRMLFRPLRPWRILGVRVPMTPGVIPSKRGQLAENIGDMVGEHLLTGEDIRRALASARFQEELRQLVGGRLDTLLNRELGPVANLVPGRFQPYFKVGIKILRWRFLKHLHAHLDSDQVADNLGRSIHGHLNQLLAKEIQALLPAEGREHLTATGRRALEHFLTSQRLQAKAQSLVSAEIETFLERDGSLRDLLPHSLLAPLLDRLEAEAPTLLAHLASLLGEPAVQERIGQAITSAIQRFATSLGPMAALVSGFLSPELIDRKVREWLTDKGDTLAELLGDDTARASVAKLLREKADQLLDTPIQRLLEQIDPTRRDQAREWLASQAAQLLGNPTTVNAVATLLEAGMTNQAERPLHAVLVDLFGPDSPGRTTDWACRELSAILRSPQTKRMLDSLVIELVEEKLLSQPIGKLSTFLPKEVQAGLRDYLLEQVAELLIREVPGLLDTLNLRNIVVRKINSLDLLHLERLLLSIMEEQFKYINLMGGLLGFLIGLVNLLFLGS